MRKLIQLSIAYVGSILIQLCILLCFAALSCTPGGDEPPPPAPPEEPEGPRPTDYIRLERVPIILEWQSSDHVGLVAGAQSMAWAGWRDPLNVVVECPWASDYLGMMTVDELTDFAQEGEALTDRAQNWFIPRFPDTNRRCREGHREHHPEFCKVTNIRKSVFEPFRVSFWAHLERATAMADRAGRCREAIHAAGGQDYDSIVGFCSAMNGLEWGAEDCP